MRPDRRAESSQVIAALEDRDNAALGMLVGQFHHVEGGPDEIRLGQLESPQGIAAMSIEAGRDNYQIGPEGIDGRQDDRAHRLAETVRSIAGPERRIENIPDAGFGYRAGSWIERHLMRRTIEKVAIRPEDLLGTVAVMDIEVDDRDALGIVAGAGMERCNGGIVEEAEAHGAAGFSVMAGRTYGAEGIRGLAGEYCIAGSGGGSDPAQGGFERARRHPGIGIELLPFPFRIRNSSPNRADVVFGMSAGDILILAARGLLAVKFRESRVLQDSIDRPQTIDAFGMAGRRLVLETGRMGEKPRDHEDSA